MQTVLNRYTLLKNLCRIAAFCADKNQPKTRMEVRIFISQTRGSVSGGRVEVYIRLQDEREGSPPVVSLPGVCSRIFVFALQYRKKREE